ncbi:amidohydrolase [Sinomonas sp. JGH33]|uniref:Amidohydrolase n=1 Tax=Sinomonas terricola TaxID=3110330 RepID=A0ABU5T654_9MICC|nr:amidohydrolase [Sinomonas sp. JGH33]MEA5455146.1 amidohydrolase [Sinomonas sp. JGH33]
MTDAIDLAIVSTTILAGASLEAAPGVVAVDDGRIVAVGGPDAVDGWTARARRVIDVGDATVSPGLVDAHIHPILGGDIARGVDLSGLTHRAAVREALAAHAAAPGEGWVFGWGLDPAAFEGAEPSHELFDGILDGERVFVTLFDGHAALVSAAGLDAAGITGAEEVLGSGFVGVDAAGRPTGMLYEMAAQELVRRILPVQGFDDRVDDLDVLLRGMAEAGLVAGQMLDLGVPESLDVLEALEARGELAIRLRVSPWIMPGATRADLDGVAALQGRRGRRWEVRGVKLMMDGTIDNGTAWLFAPDAHGESLDPLWNDPLELVAALRYFHELGIPTATHAIGDRAVAFVARAISELEPNGTVHRIEHIETIPDEVLAEVVASGATTSLQPTHCALYSRADHSDNWSRRLGAERANLAWRTGDLRRAGAVVALGSDWPIAPYDPRATIASAQTRRPAGRPDVAPIQPRQALSARAALERYTSEYWRSVGEAGGVIEAGARADLTVFRDNPLTTAPDDFAASPVLLTVVDGDVVVEATGVAPRGEDDAALAVRA